MIAVDIIVSGFILGGMYAMVALGLTLQYGVARIMNLAYGEFLLAGSFAAWWLYAAHAVSPLVGLIVIVPIAFVANWLVYELLLMPLVRRAKHREQLEADFDPVHLRPALRSAGHWPRRLRQPALQLRLSLHSRRRLRPDGAVEPAGRRRLRPGDRHRPLRRPHPHPLRQRRQGRRGRSTFGAAGRHRRHPRLRPRLCRRRGAVRGGRRLWCRCSSPSRSPAASSSP